MEEEEENVVEREEVVMEGEKMMMDEEEEGEVMMEEEMVVAEKKNKKEREEEEQEKRNKRSDHKVLLQLNTFIKFNTFSPNLNSWFLKRQMSRGKKTPLTSATQWQQIYWWLNSVVDTLVYKYNLAPIQRCCFFPLFCASFFKTYKPRH